MNQLANFSLKQCIFAVNSVNSRYIFSSHFGQVFVFAMPNGIALHKKVTCDAAFDVEPPEVSQKAGVYFISYFKMLSRYRQLTSRTDSLCLPR